MTRALHLVKTAVGAAWALRLTARLREMGHDIHVALPEGPLRREYEASGVRTHVLQTDFPVRRPHRFPSVARALRRLVREVGPDVIHSHFVGTTLTMRLALGSRERPIPRLFQVPGPLHLESPIVRRAELASAGPLDSWIASCEWTRRRYLRSGVPPERVFLAYYGMDFDRFRPAPAGGLRRELGLSSEVRVVGMVAYIYAPKRLLGQTRGLKGHEDLIDAVARLRARGRDVVCVFAGGAWDGADAYERRVREYARRRCGDRAVFLGTRTDVRPIYADFDVAVHPSHSENLGGAVESLALGVPTVATRVGGFPDVVVPGRTGWLVPPRRPAHLAAAIEQVLDDPALARRLASDGRRLVLEKLDLSANAERVAEAYRRSMGAR